MMLVTAVLFVSPIVLALCLRRGRIGMGLILGLGQGQWLSGAYAASGFGRLFWVCAIGAVSLLVGYGIGGLGAGRPDADREAVRGRRAALGPLAVITIVLVVVHFVRGGVPILSSNVETSRFDLASSGLLGMPSRAHLYGLPLIFLSYASLRDRSRDESRMFGAVSIAFVLSRLAGGLKSGLLEVVFVLLIAITVRSAGRARLVSRAMLRLILVALGATVSAIYVAAQYNSVGVRTWSDGLWYLVRRATAGSVSSGEYVIEHPGLLKDRPYILGDWLYYIDRYAAGIPRHLGAAVPDYSLSRTVSTGLEHLPVWTQEYVSPVTPGLSPTFFLDGGWALVPIGMLLVGLLVGRSEANAIRREGLISGSWAVLGLITCYAATNGGPGYYLTNIVIVIAVYVAAAWLMRSTRARSSRRPPLLMAIDRSPRRPPW